MVKFSLYQRRRFGRLIALSFLAIWVLVLLETVVVDAFQLNRATVYTYLVTFIIGCLFGFSELAFRYRDDPIGAALSPPGYIYALINGAISATALWFIQVFELTATDNQPSQLATHIYQVILASGTGMTAFRSVFINIKDERGEFGIGLNTLVQRILRSVDNAVDRYRSEVRSGEIADLLKNNITSKMMGEVVFVYCQSIMQNVDKADWDRVKNVIDAQKQYDFHDRVKAANIGLSLYSVMGYASLETAISHLEKMDVLNCLSPADEELLGLEDRLEAYKILSGLASGLDSRVPDLKSETVRTGAASSEYQAQPSSTKPTRASSE